MQITPLKLLYVHEKGNWRKVHISGSKKGKTDGGRGKERIIYEQGELNWFEERRETSLILTTVSSRQ